MSKMDDRDVIDTIRSIVNLGLSEYIKMLKLELWVAHNGVVMSEEIGERSVESVLSNTG